MDHLEDSEERTGPLCSRARYICYAAAGVVEGWISYARIRILPGGAVTGRQYT